MGRVTDDGKTRAPDRIPRRYRKSGGDEATSRSQVLDAHLDSARDLSLTWSRPVNHAVGATPSARAVGSVRALRTIAIGRKNWLFFGSDDHAAANLFSLVASCKLHGLDPELYLRDVIRVVPHWPTDRFLEVSRLHWASTRVRLDVDQLAAEVGDLTITPPAEQ